ncbi:hypothetical protein C8F01DRAFT_1136387 [Mycena amicta]|nr:hypothetical protein C8F01DRAFT_1136387 [Mycena amicta]
MMREFFPPCNWKPCKKAGTKKCGRCKRPAYCSVECQRKAWPKHKKECTSDARERALKGVNLTPFFSEYGMIHKTDTHELTPVSILSQFFLPETGYPFTKPEHLFEDLVDAYRVLRLGEHLNARRLPAHMARNISFDVWMERVSASGLLPPWWRWPFHGVSLDIYTARDKWGRLDREVSIREIEERPRADRSKSMFRFGMIIEAALWQDFLWKYKEPGAPDEGSTSDELDEDSDPPNKPNDFGPSLNDLD